MEHVILVDGYDKETGHCEKMEVHERGLLHRAFSVFVFNTQGALLLQKRASSKYHSGGKWTNTCCGHPRPGESVEQAARRRLTEEMGLQCNLSRLFSFHYKAEFPEDGLVENEIDHVWMGVTDTLPKLNPDEAEDYSYVSPEDIKNRLSARPDDFTIWFRLCFDRVLDKIKETRFG